MTKDDYASLHLFLEEAEALLQKWERLMDVVTEIESIQLRLGEVGRIERMMQLLDMFEAQNYMLKDFLTIDDAAMYLNLSKSTIYKMTSRGELPCYKPNSKTLFLKREEVNDWIQGRKHLSESELNQIAERYAQQLVKPNIRKPGTPHFKKRK